MVQKLLPGLVLRQNAGSPLERLTLSESFLMRLSDNRIITVAKSRWVLRRNGSYARSLL